MKLKKKGKTPTQKIISKIDKSFKKKIISKGLVKKPKLTVRIPEHKVENIFDDPNRFFKNEMEEAKKSMFFND